MTLPYRISHRITAAIATACAGLALASAAEAVDLRDWGRKFPASERFVVLAQFNNEAVLDKETQLVWERTPDTTLRDWRDANRTCSYKTLGDRGGWRLPFIHELNSLVDPSAAAGQLRLPAGHPFNISGSLVTSSKFWTATADDDGSGAYAVYFKGTGSWVNAQKEVSFRGWCVRGNGGSVQF